MAEKRIGIQVAVEEGSLSKAQQDFEKFSGSGIQAVEDLEQSFLKLRKTGVQVRDEFDKNLKAQKTLNQAFKEGKISGDDYRKTMDTLKRSHEGLSKESTRLKREMETNRLAIERFNTQQRLTQEKAQLLASQFGIALPGAMAKYTSQLGVVQKAMSLAFPITLVAGFAGVIGTTLIPKLVEVGRWLTDISERSKVVLEIIRESNRSALTPQTAGQANVILTDLQHERNNLENILALRREAQANIELGLPLSEEQLTARSSPLGKSAALETRLIELEQDIERARNSSDALTKREEERVRQRAKQSRKFIEGAQGLSSQGARGIIAGIEGESRQVFAIRSGQIQDANRREIEGMKQVAAEDIEAMRKRAAAVGQLLGIRERAELARLEPNRRAIRAIQLNEEKLVRELQDLKARGLIDEKEFQDARTALAIDASAQQREAFERAAEDYRNQIESQARDLESLFDRTLGSARSWKEAITNIWREIGDVWKRQMFEMLAASLGGRGVGTATTAGAGIAIPGIGGVFGGGGGLGGIGPGGTPPFIANAFPGGFGSGGGAGAVSTGAGANTASALGFPGTTPLGNIFAGALSNPALLGLGGLAGTSLIGNRNRTVSALGGFFGGGALGLAAGSAFGGSLGLLGAFAGPIGAAVGLGLGLIFGGGGADKEHDTAIQQQGERVMFQALEDFKRQRIDFSNANSLVEEAFQQMVAQFRRPQSRQIPENERANILKEIRDIEDERNRRRQLLALQGLPEFAEGGFVTGGGGVLARLHAGEFVMNKSAVDRLGVTLLEGLNRSGGAAEAGGGATVTMEVPSQEFFNDVVERSIPVILRRGGSASRRIRR